MENFWSLTGNWRKSFFVFGDCINIWLSAGLGAKSVILEGQAGAVGESLTQKLVFGVYSGVGYDFSRAASGKPKEVCVPCTNAGHFIPHNDIRRSRSYLLLFCLQVLFFPFSLLHLHVLLPLKPNLVFGDKHICFESFTRRPIL